MLRVCSTVVATPREVGLALIIDFGCSCGGTLRWESQTRIVKMTGKFVGNILSYLNFPEVSRSRSFSTTSNHFNH